MITWEQINTNYCGVVGIVEFYRIHTINRLDRTGFECVHFLPPSSSSEMRIGIFSSLEEAKFSAEGHLREWLKRAGLQVKPVPEKNLLARSMDGELFDF